jgi:uncharacterized protein involved in exopolysaccharide biosynthesis
MTSYLKTFRRHPRLFLLPIVLTTLVALWFVAGSPSAYESTASLWVDNPPPATSSLNEANPTIQTPAEEEQLLINELLQTKSFRLAVGHNGPLAAYLGRDPGQGWGPPALFAMLSGGGSVNSRILSALSSKKIELSVAGPQVIQVRYRAGTPQVATGTLAAFVKQLDRQRLQLSMLRGRSALAYYKAQVAAASKAVVTARQRTAAYVSDHPGATPASDPNLKALKRGEIAAASQLAQATARVNRASSRVDAAVGAGNAFAVLDAPKVPSGPVGKIKQLLLALVGGLFAGALISFLAVVVLTRGADDAPNEPFPDVAAADGHSRAPGPDSSLVLDGETSHSASPSGRWEQGGWDVWEQPTGQNGD